MRRRRTRRKIWLLLSAGFVTVGVMSASTGKLPATVSVDGSSTVYPVTEAVAEEFQALKRGEVRVTVGISGTGGGFKKFCRGEVDVQNASRSIQSGEMKACREAGIGYFEFPVAYDALTVVVHPGNTWATDITVEELKKIWEPTAQGKITKWSQVRKGWPDEPLTLYGAGADSGTFDYFTEAIVGKAKSSRGDYTASEDDNTLVLGVSKDPHALGYIPFSYYDSNKSKLKLVAVHGGPKAPKQSPVLPSSATVTDGTYFPLSRPLFIYVSDKASARPEVKAFVEFYLTNAGNLSKEVSYVGLPQSAYTQALDHYAKGRKGTAFGGHSEVGMSISEMLSRETKL